MTSSPKGGAREQAEVIEPLPLMERSDWLGRLLRITRRLVVPVLLLGTWTIITYIWPLVFDTRLIRPIFLPGPQDLIKAGTQMAPYLPEAMLSSVSMTLLGFLLGTALGIAIDIMGECVNIIGVQSIFNYVECCGCEFRCIVLEMGIKKHGFG